MGKRMTNEYEGLRNENIELNEVERKRKTRSTKPSKEAPQNRPNLRSSKTLQQIVRDEDIINQNGTEVTCLNGHPEEENNDADSGQPKKRNTRGITRKQNIWSRENTDKLTLQVNDYGQPIGKNATEFSNFIGTMVRTKGFFPVSYTDWRLVPHTVKMKLLHDVQLYYEVDESLCDWVLATAAKKWKDFKADLKKQFINKICSGLSNDLEFHDIRDDRINEEDWDWLVNHWTSEEAQARSERGKSNRMKVQMHHTAGSKSFARVGHEMHEESGKKPRRDEVFIKTHARGCDDKIKALQDIAELHPELKENDINEGDIFYHVFGNEKKGIVRGLGLGPTPHSLELPGFSKYTSTKVQIVLESRRKVVEENTLLREQLEAMQKQLEELKKLNQTSEPMPTSCNSDTSISEDEQTEDDLLSADTEPLTHDIFTKKHGPPERHDKVRFGYQTPNIISRSTPVAHSKKMNPTKRKSRQSK